MFKTLFATLAIAFLCAGSLITGPLGPGIELPSVPQTEETPAGPATEPVVIPPTPGARMPTPMITQEDAAAMGKAARVQAQDDHFFRFMRDVINGADVRTLTRDVQDYYHATGFAVPQVTQLNEFDENETIAYVYNIGDLDHDGVDDFAMDLFCTNTEGCRPTLGCPVIPNPFRPDFLECIQKTPEVRLEKEEWCTTPHRLMMFSGANGTEIWRRDLSQRPTIFDVQVPPDAEHMQKALTQRCFFEMVIGKIPSPDGGETVLIYRFEPKILPHALFEPRLGIFGYHDESLVWEHSVYAIDRFTGGVLWSTPTYQGWCAAVGAGLAVTGHCENLLANPILQVPPDRGVRVVPAGTEPTLYIQGVTFDFTVVVTPPIPTETWWRDWVLDYQPNEWIDRINLVDGTPLVNHASTFTPHMNGRDQDMAVVPRALPEFIPVITPFIIPPPQRDDMVFTNCRCHIYQGDVLISSIYYWSYVPCCFDVNGDKVPDLVFTTLEWDNKPIQNTNGPYMLQSRLVAFNGFDGGQLWETVLDAAMPQYRFEEFDAGLGVFPFTALSGDLDGDGISDMLVHRMFFQYDFQNIIEGFNGMTGKRLWGYQSPRNMAPIIIGDSDKDGGNDVLLVDWFDWQHPGITTYDFNNVTAKPIILVNGKDGHTLWRAETFSAPTDLAFIVLNYRINGVPDLNGDGVGEFPADDPIVLPDLTVVHQWRMLHGVTGEPLRRITTVGQFSIPSYGGNVTGNAFDDLFILTGDIADLWVTLYDGETVQGVWSRRVMTPRLTEYTLAAPLIRYFPIEHRQSINDTLMNFHFTVTNCGGLVCSRASNPQVAYYTSINGTSAWAYPKFWDPNITFRVWGPTPASLAFANLAAQYAERSGYAAATVENGSYVVPGLVTFGATALVCFGLGRRRWSK